MIKTQKEYIVLGTLSFDGGQHGMTLTSVCHSEGAMKWRLRNLYNSSYASATSLGFLAAQAASAVEAEGPEPFDYAQDLRLRELSEAQAEVEGRPSALGD